MISQMLKLKNSIDHSPQIHCISNPTTLSDCANVVLALGGNPILAEHPDEVCEITQNSKALALNIGYISNSKIKAMMLAGKTALENDIPSIIDIVGVSYSSLRLRFAKEYIKKFKPKVVKGNLSEVKTLVGLRKNGIGESATDDLIDTFTLSVFSDFSKEMNCIIFASGKTDLIVDKEKAYIVKNGVPMLAKINGTGSMLNVMIATFLSKKQYLEATLLSATIMGIAGEMSEDVKGVMSFKNKLIDTISLISDDEIIDRIKIKEVSI